MAASREYFYGVDLLRFSSALMVACFHIGYSSFKPNSRGAPLVDGLFSFPEGGLFFWGAVGVQIFFVISGFVIANSANGATPFQFFRSRVERLYPAVWICASLTGVVWLISGAEPVREVIVEYLHTVTLWPFGTWIDAPYWTIACEIGFYSLVFLLLLGGSFDRLREFAIGMVFVSAAFWLLHVAAMVTNTESSVLDFFARGAGRVLPVYYGPYFGLGMLTWLWRRGNLGLLGWTAAFVALAMGLLETTGAGIVRDALDGTFAGGYGAERFVQPLVWLGATVIVVLSSARPAARDTAPATLRILRCIGLATYPLYLLHFALGVWTMRLLATSGVAPAWAFAFAILLVCSLSFVITIYGEPFLRTHIRATFNHLEAISGGEGWISRTLHRSGGVVPDRRLGIPVLSR